MTLNYAKISMAHFIYPGEVCRMGLWSNGLCIFDLVRGISWCMQCVNELAMRGDLYIPSFDILACNAFLVLVPSSCMLVHAQSTMFWELSITCTLTLHPDYCQQYCPLYTLLLQRSRLFVNTSCLCGKISRFCSIYWSTLQSLHLTSLDYMSSYKKYICEEWNTSALSW